MVKILKCPRCQEKIDVSDLSGGSTVKCEACGTMVRLASGGTQKVPAAAPPPPPAAAPRKDRSTKVRAAGGGAGAGRQTDLFRKMSNAKAPGEKGRGGRGGGGEKAAGSNTTMIIAIAAGAILVIGGIAFAVLSGKDHGSAKSGTSEGKSKEKDSTAGSKKKKKDEPRKVEPTPPPVDDGVWQPGALALVDKATTPMMKLNPETNAQYELLAGAGKVADIVSADYRWITYAINGLLSDNETIVKSSMDAMHQIINRRKLDASQSELAKKPIIYKHNVAANRQSEYYYWATWWFTITAQNTVASWRESAGAGADSAPSGGGAPGNASSERWAETLSACKSGGFTNSANESYYHYQRIKSMGKSAYQPLISFIDNEDTGLGTAAVLILKELSGRSDAPSRVTDANKATIKADWEGWLKTAP